jgi:hypothetical protein
MGTLWDEGNTYGEGDDKITGHSRTGYFQFNQGDGLDVMSIASTTSVLR